MTDAEKIEKQMQEKAALEWNSPIVALVRMAHPDMSFSTFASIFGMGYVEGLISGSEKVFKLLEKKNEMHA